MRKLLLSFVLCVATIMAAGFAAPSPAQSPATPKDSTPQGSPVSSEESDRAVLTEPVVTACSYMPNPPYSKEARDAKFQGTILVDGVVMPDGKVTNLRILKSPGLGLDQVVLETMKKWKCTSTTHDGKRVSTKVNFQINFRLSSNR
jgi:TonB family protein